MAHDPYYYQEVGKWESSVIEFKIFDLLRQWCKSMGSLSKKKILYSEKTIDLGL